MLGIPATTTHRNLFFRAFQNAAGYDDAACREIKALYKRPDFFFEFLRAFFYSHKIDDLCGCKCTGGCQRIIADGTSISVLRYYLDCFEEPWRPGTLYTCQSYSHNISGPSLTIVDNAFRKCKWTILCRFIFI